MRDHTTDIQDYDVEERMLSCNFVASNIVFLDSIDRKAINIPTVNTKFVLHTPDFLSAGKKPIVR
ncbi:predicted ORF [Xanthomonas phage XacN1]|nr:predicted ORF [Xanthomonas phage XacN1]